MDALALHLKCLADFARFHVGLELRVLQGFILVKAFLLR